MEVSNMCVIVVQNKNVFPSWDTLKNCWDSNPHGAGFMYHEKEKVRISKGFMSWEEFKKAVSEVKDYTSRPMVYHFRISSHGGISPQNTHPFPFSNNVEPMKALDLLVPVGIAHNGIISYRSYSSYLQEYHNIPDTAQFLRERYSTLKHKNYVKKSALDKALSDEAKLSNSRFVLMDSKEIRTYGHFYSYGNCLYSNGYSHLKTSVYKPYSKEDLCKISYTNGSGKKSWKALINESRKYVGDE